MKPILNLKNDINAGYLTKTNRTAATNKVNEYLVIHYVGAQGGALANAKYYQNEYRGASAHYFVDHSGPIYMSVKPGDIAWHCGRSDGKYKHKYCRNKNSIGIEMCCYKNAEGKWYFTDVTVDKTVELVVALMYQYDIPLSHVIRHYDVTGKICPEPYVSDTKAWNAFLKKVKTRYNEFLGTWKTVKQSYLREPDYTIVNDYKSLGITLKKKCNQAINGSVTFKADTTYTLVGIKQDDNGSIWAIMKSKYLLPMVFKGTERSVKVS